MNKKKYKKCIVSFVPNWAIIMTNLFNVSLSFSKTKKKLIYKKSKQASNVMNSKKLIDPVIILSKECVWVIKLDLDRFKW